MKKSRKFLAALLAVTAMTTCFAGCGKDDEGGSDVKSQDVYVITREDGSGTRGAFIELMGIEQKNADGKKEDKTVETAEVTNSTAVMLTTVQGNAASIGYVSLGSLDTSKVKAVKIDGAEATVENIKSGAYKIARPFNIAVKDDLSDAGQDFINFILSTEGQKVVTDNGYIALDDTKAYEKSDAKGKVVVGGSSSVTPVMEKLKEAYAKINTDVEIEVQGSDSSTGMKNAISGTYNIGMASREVKAEEKEQGLTEIKIATDGVAVIVNKDNSVDSLTKEQVMKIYTGEIKTWGDVQ